jgi:phosphohistidine phosphatase
MKTLYIVRHAKSSWKQDYLSDFERPLNKRGHGDAPIMGRVLRERGARVQYIRSSPANRALTTARILATELGCDLDCIETDEHMYGAGDRQLLDIVHAISDEVQDAMLVGHNPGMMMLAEHLSGFDEANLPTCGIVCVDFSVDAWRDASAATGTLRYFEYPKNHH